MVEILKLPADGWQAYRQLRLRALREDPDAFSSAYTDSLKQPEEFWRRRLDDAAAARTSWLLFARRDRKLVGMIGAFLEDGSTNRATVVSVYVPREERGKGISTRLMQEMLDVLSRVPGLKQAHLAVNVTQLAAIHLYMRFGFLEVGRKPVITGAGQPVEQIIMERDLPFSA